MSMAISVVVSPAPRAPLPEAAACIQRIIERSTTLGVVMPVEIRYTKSDSGRALEITMSLQIGEMKLTLSRREWSQHPALSELAEKAVRGELDFNQGWQPKNSMN